ncbi:hypothetical protein RZQ20_22040 [Raoultella ornithinolytica]|uniref:hypothetical protein n=1 Tax=Raoultella ornithinolytica TaxID=54291 RepID=UPI00292B4E24|nr:hypothetical protein [Raoultella ornithinolytica]MDV1094948.1 hypothetical protein [Raoultella ornithinolytica]MDV1122708.1 hypothetical protein [Raoultella ornithinolytica]MDV1893223.1 hypothetical protein [Raoultella ornithinolytica]
MKKNWLKERLPKAKRDSNLWGAFTDALQEMWNESVEPVLIRISNRKSFFTMNSEDMETRIAEYGRFFVIPEKDKSRRPMLLTQRLDEIHFKGTTRPIEQTFWREFGEMPITWEPLYAPVDLKKTPYGQFLATAREVEGAQSTYGDFFLTSRARIVLDLNMLYERYGTEWRNDAIRHVQENFASTIAPLIPLHIVFDGLTLQLIVAAYEKYDVLYQRKTDVLVDAGFKAHGKADRVNDHVETNVGNRDTYQTKGAPRSLESIPVCFDAMPLDGWPLGLLEIIPPIIPSRHESDPRLYEQDTPARSDEKRLMLKTLGQFGCLVEYSDGQLARLGFPGAVSDVVLQLVAGDWRKTIRKVIYLSSIDEVRYDFKTREEMDRAVLANIDVAQNRGIALSESDLHITVKSGSVADKALLKSKSDRVNSPVITDKYAVTPFSDKNESAQFNASQTDDRYASHEGQKDAAVVVSSHVSDTQVNRVKGIPRALETVPMNYDEVPLDLWLTDQVYIIPPIIPGNNEDDPRLYEQVATGEVMSVPGETDRLYRSGETRLMLKSLGQAGCLVEYSDGSIIRFCFPANTDAVVLQAQVDDWRKNIRKISYLSGLPG